MNTRTKPQAFNPGNGHSNVTINKGLPIANLNSVVKTLNAATELIKKEEDKEDDMTNQALTEISKSLTALDAKFSSLDAKIDAQAKLFVEKFDALESALIGKVGNVSSTAAAVIPRFQMIEKNMESIATKENLNAAISQHKDAISASRWDIGKWAVGIAATIILGVSTLALNSYRILSNSQSDSSQKILDKLNSMDAAKKASSTKP